MVKVTLRGRQLVGGLYGAEKRQSEKNYFPLQKLMIMSSYLMDSNYIDPKFPPCEEYSQNNYIPDHSPEYYSRTRESSYQHHHPELYPVPRPSFPDRQFSCGSIQQAAGNQRGHGQTAGGQQHLSEKAQQLCEQAALSTTSTTPSPAPPACNQPNPDHPNSTASKQPIVYPWMKKIHVSTGMQLLFSFFCLSLCALVFSRRALSLPLPLLSPPPPSSFSLSLSLFFISFPSMRGFGLAQLNWIYDSEWVITPTINFIAELLWAASAMWFVLLCMCETPKAL